MRTCIDSPAKTLHLTHSHAPIAMHTSLQQEIAQAAAALIVDEGLEIGPAKQRALKQLGLRPNTALPDNRSVEDAVREHIALFHADTQPQVLQALRDIAAHWMQQLAEFEPLLGGAVWNGTATHWSPIHLQLFCDDSKALPIWLLNHGLDFDTQEAKGLGGQPTEVLGVHVTTQHPALQPQVLLCLWNNPSQALRGALQADADGQAPRGTLQGLQARMTETGAMPQSPKP